MDLRGLGSIRFLACWSTKARSMRQESFPSQHHPYPTPHISVHISSCPIYDIPNDTQSSQNIVCIAYIALRANTSNKCQSQQPSHHHQTQDYWFFFTRNPERYGIADHSAPFSNSTTSHPPSHSAAALSALSVSRSKQQSPIKKGQPST